MSELDKKISFIIETIDKTENGINKVTDNIKVVENATKNANETFTQSSQKTSILNSNYIKLAAGVAGATIAFKALYNPASAIAEAVERQSLMLGLSTKQMQEWNFVATQNKGSIEGVTMGFTILTTKAYEAYNGNKEALKSFKDLGVSVTSANGDLKSNDAIINEVIGKLSGISRESERASKAQDLFGRSGRELLPLLAQGKAGIDAQRESAQKLGQVLSNEAIGNLTKTGDAFDALKTSVSVAGGELISVFLPALVQVLSMTTKVAAAVSDLIRPDTELEGYAKKIANIKAEIDRTSKYSRFDGKTAELKEELAFYQSRYNMALKLSQLTESDKASGTIKTTNSAPVNPKTKTSFDDYAYKIGMPSQANIEAVTKQAEQEIEIWKSAEDWYRQIKNDSFEDAKRQYEQLSALKLQTAESDLSLVKDSNARELTLLEQKNAKKYTLSENSQKIISSQLANELLELDNMHSQELLKYENVLGAKEQIDLQYANKKTLIERNSLENSRKIAEQERMMKLSNFQQIGSSFVNLMGVIGEANKKNAKAQQATAIIQSIVNTALGVTQAIAQGGVAGIVTGILVGAAGAIQTGIIASQNFALGGFAKRNPGAVSDNVNINVNPDEGIVTKRQQTNLTRFFNNPEENSSRGDTYHIYDSTGDLVETLVTKIRNGQGDKLFNILKSRYSLA